MGTRVSIVPTDFHLQKKRNKKNLFCMLPCLPTRAPGVNSHDIHTL